jgi:hypothetical protein
MRPGRDSVIDENAELKHAEHQHDGIGTWAARGPTMPWKIVGQSGTLAQG